VRNGKCLVVNVQVGAGFSRGLACIFAAQQSSQAESDL
jgi:hypothetical protein